MPVAFDTVLDQSNDPKPPTYDPNDPRWEKGPSSRSNRRGVPQENGGSGGKYKEGESWWHPEEGEWRRHEDKHHDPHWDHNEWNDWNDEWRNVDDDGQQVWDWGNVPSYPPDLGLNILNYSDRQIWDWDNTPSYPINPSRQVWDWGNAPSYSHDFSF